MLEVAKVVEVSVVAKIVPALQMLYPFMFSGPVMLKPERVSDGILTSPLIVNAPDAPLIMEAPP